MIVIFSYDCLLSKSLTQSTYGSGMDYCSYTMYVLGKKGKTGVMCFSVKNTKKKMTRKD